jgi:hypothetical protein
MKRIALVVGTLLAAGCGGPYRLAAPAERVDLGVYTVEPQLPWSMSSGRTWQAWTVDGFALHEVSFVIGLKDEQALYPRLQQREKAPLFRSSMSPPEVAEFIKSSLEMLLGAKKLKASEPKPQSFGSFQGFRLEIEFTDATELDVQGLVVWAVQGGRLYLIFHRAAKEYYFPKYRDAVERLVASIRWAG